MARMFLAMNGKRINTLDDLRSNFNGKSMLDYFRSGRLQKWLAELGETDMLETLDGFESGYDDQTLLSMLMAAFELEDSEISEVTQKFSEEEKKSEPEAAGNPEAITEEKLNGQNDKNADIQEQEVLNISEICGKCEGSGHMGRVFNVKPCDACNATGKCQLAGLLNSTEFREACSAYRDYSVKDRYFLALADKVWTTIRSAVEESPELSSKKRNAVLTWENDFEKIYGIDSTDIGIYEKIQKVFSVDYLLYSYSPKDILESLLDKVFPEMLDGGELRPRYEELLQKVQS